MLNLYCRFKGSNKNSVLTLVFDISDVAVLVSGVGDDLSAAVGEGNAVRAGGLVAVTGLAVAVVGVRVLVVHGVLESVLGSNTVRYLKKVLEILFNVLKVNS